MVEKPLSTSRSADPWSTRGPLLAGAAAIIAGIGTFGAWSAATEINGAVIAPGQVQVEERRQQIQHPFGGVVAEIAVRDGGHVKAGQTIIRLDGTELQAEAALFKRALFEARAKIDRLNAEVRANDTFLFRDAVTNAAGSDTVLAAVLDDERTLFETRRNGVAQTIGQLDERIVQAQAVINGRNRQAEASRQQLGLIQAELAGAEKLLKDKLIEITRVSSLRREAARLNGEIGELEAGIAEARGSIAGFEIEKLRYRTAWSEQAQDELRSLQPREAELTEKLGVVETKLARLTMQAPMDGVVYGLKVFTVGGVVAAGSEVAAIVPAGSDLNLAVRVDPLQIDRISAGQKAVVRFPNFNAHTTPELPGVLHTISADVLADATTGQPYYLAEVRLEPGALELLGGQALMPGMPVEAFIQTGARSPLSFMVKPFTDYFDHAMREE
jgi:HlyD family type I secretion membrane fusion protein